MKQIPLNVKNFSKVIGKKYKIDHRVIMKNIPYSPFLFAIFPILILLGNNIDQVVFTVAVRSMVISCLGTGVLFLMLRLLLRQWSSAAVITSLCVFLFYSYGHVYKWVQGLGEIGEIFGRHRFIVPVWLGFLIFGIWYIRRRKDELGTIVRIFNIFGVAALILPLIQILSFSYGSRRFSPSDSRIVAQEGESQLSLDQRPPDIYYFILDAYTRQDVLLESFNYDNSEFLEALESLGFYVAYCSQSNYTQTNLSMASTFNMNYLQNLLGDSLTSGDEMRIPGFNRSNLVRDSLEELGYTIVAFETGFYAIQWMDADIYLFPPRSASLGEFFNITEINGFESLLIQTTAAWALVDLVDLPDQMEKFVPDLHAPISIYRERNLYVLDQFQIDRVPSIQGPKFVYAHLILPHPPYVFGPNGEEIHDEKKDADREAYRDQLIYTNKRILEIVERMIKGAPKPHIIILQGDHGLLSDPDKRVAILNAYYFSDWGDELLYPSISPVNSFRIIFDHYFHGDYELLEDVSYYSWYDDPLDFDVVPQTTYGKCLIGVDS
ncbi:MAG: hypothetical protein P8Z41_09710 [Anaerolineales bacterium]